MPWKALYGILCLLCLTMGFLIGKYRLTPNDRTDKPDTEYDPALEEIHSVYRETDVRSLIQIHDTADITEKRRTLIRFIWGDAGFPDTRMPEQVEHDISDDRYDNISALKRIDKLTVEMAYGLYSRVYLFHPDNPNNKLAVVHAGHGQDFFVLKHVIKSLLENQYAVLGIAMPLMGMNNKPRVDFPRFSTVKIERHDHFKLLESESFCPIQFFLTPVAVALNYTEAAGKYTSFSMIGLSGGGWTTTLYAAIDTRIIRSYPVAGTYPLYLRSESPRSTWGDYEQNLPALFRIANYLELYVMGAIGENRKQLQVLNKYDSCCFNGIKSQTYVNIVRDVVTELGDGAYDCFLDDSHRGHKISEIALSRILANMES